VDTGGVPVTAFSSAENAAVFKTAAERTAEAAAWYRRRYGFFPVPALGVIQGHPRWGGGYPLPNVFMIHLGNLTPDFVSWITAHEIGHYFWGLHVLDDGERLGWLTLANGIWADQLYMAERKGVELDEQWRSPGNGDWILDYLQAKLENREERLGLNREDERGLGFDYNSLIRHGKGALGLRLQARRLGTEAYLEFQRSILDKYKHRPLPEEDFFRLLEEAGADGARDFFSVWKRGDARIGADIISVDTTGITVRRTGNVPYPIDIEVLDHSNRRTRTALLMEEDEKTIDPGGILPKAVNLDPDGVVPIWNSSHAGIRSLFVQAFHRAGETEPFLSLAAEHLAGDPEDDRIRYLLSRRLFLLGRYEEVVALGSFPAPASRLACLSAIYRARSLGRLGEIDEARSVLEMLRDWALELGVSGTWEAAFRGLG
jgi:hypothetical protein